MKILLIDNDLESLESIKAALLLNGYDVTGFTDFDEAKNDYITKRFDLLITDFHLDKNAKGTDFLNFESFEKNVVPIILMSGDPELDLKNIPQNIKIQKYLKKPVNIVLLLDELNNIN